MSIDNIVFAQLNTNAGNIEANFSKIRNIIADYNTTSNLIIFPEMALSGYPCSDILQLPQFHNQCQLFLDELARFVAKPTVVIGTPVLRDGILFNAAVVLKSGKQILEYYKHNLPNYSVFDEKRYFTAGTEYKTFTWNKQRVALAICEDLWDEGFIAKLPDAELLVSLNASPFTIDKQAHRAKILTAISKSKSLNIAYINQAGAEDELVFDGHSMLVTPATAFVFAGFVESVATIKQIATDNNCLEDKQQNIHDALVLGIKDYFVKNQFKKAIIGSSGGIDSAVALCLAVQALGSENVVSAMLSYKYTSADSIKYAEQLANNLSIKHRHIDIVDAVAAIINSFADNTLTDLTLQNIQSRVRANILMAIANNENRLLLTTGNKSEMAVGYSTIYGDMCGAFNVIKDLYKTEVYALAKHINKKQLIPSFIIDREPSAELAKNQKDSDSLPPYRMLDKILYGYIEQKQSPKQLSSEAVPIILVEHIVNKIKLNEYKRQQSPPGVKISEVAFGKDWRFPIHLFN